MEALPIIAVMIGDPGGIGPEVAVKAVASGKLAAACRPLLIGNVAALEAAAAHLPERPSFEVRASFDPSMLADPKRIAVLDPGDLAAADYTTGEPSAASGAAVLRWMSLADDLSHAGKLQGWIMAPINSTSMKLAKTYDVDALQPKGTFMFRMSGKLRVVPLSEHIPLRDVPATVTQEAVLHVVELVHATLQRWGIPEPKIAVAGLNPHAFFSEDIERIAPAVKDARGKGIDAHGPIPPDSVFRHGLEGRYDAIVSMYHDQGQIALKTAAFAGAATIYIGLPYLRATVPHGTAMDIAGKNLAQHESMLAALRTCAALARGEGFLG